MVLVATTGFQYYTSPVSGYHGPSIKYALAFAETNASVDDAPVLICSGFVESNSATMPSMETAKESLLFAPLSYYKLSEPVVPLPQSMNDEAVRVASQFLREDAQQPKRFLVLGDQVVNARTLDWFVRNAGAMRSIHNLGVFDGVEVLEFVPRAGR